MKKGRVKFIGNGFEFWLMSIFLLILSVLTAGLLLPYYVYWSVKYFITHTEFEITE